jgi:histidine phosphotransferase ChpT
MFSATGRVKVGWMVTEAALGKLPAKILLNLALIAGEALVRGGQLDIGAESHGDATEIVVRAEGPRIVLAPELRDALAGTIGADGLSARTAAPWMVHALVEQAGGQMMLSGADDPALLFGARLPAQA